MNPQSSSQSLRTAALVGTLAILAPLTGCGIGGNFAKSATGIGAGSNTIIQGKVHGGQQPVTGATIQLYAAGVPATGSGYGVGATPLLTSSVTSDASGNFSITGKYTCPTPTQQVYIVATGGNPGLGGTVNNSGLAMMASLGACPAGSTLAASIPFININEVTTVSAVWALQQFMAAPSAANKFAPNVGAPTTAYATGTTVGAVASGVIGMNNAFVTSKVLADISTGVSPNTNYAYATPESAKINTIANILSYCINSTGSDGNCASLFSAATPSGKTAAADTIQAAWYMAQNPINNLTNLYNFIPASPPFLPQFSAPGTLNSTSTAPASSAFNDTTIAINYAPTYGTGTPAVGAPYGVAIDAYGNAWISNAGGVTGTSASAAELGADGSILITPASTYTASATNGSTGQFTTAPAANTRTFSAPKGVAVDLSNRAWIANFGDAAAATATQNTGSVAVFTGSTATGLGGASGGIGSTGFYVGSGPYGIAIDGANNVFVDNSTSSSTSVLDGSSIAQLISAPGAGTDGSYTYSTSASTVAPNRTPGGGTALLAVDTNANVTGGIVWATNGNACKVTGQFNVSTYFGAISLFGDSTVAPLMGSDAVSALSNATIGAGSSTNCGSASTYVGQTFTAAAANIFGVAIDRNNGAWITDLYTSSSGFDGLTYLSAPTASTAIFGNTYSLVNGVAPTQTTAATPGTTLTKAGGIAVDGNNNAWIGNQTAKSVVEATLSGSTITLLTPGQGGSYGTGAAYGIGFQHNTVSSTGIAVDPSGNVWVANNSTGANTYTNQAATTTNYGNSMTVIVGAAGPVVTPLALAVKSNKLGAKP